MKIIYNVKGNPLTNEKTIDKRLKFKKELQLILTITILFIIIREVKLLYNNKLTFQVHQYATKILVVV